MFKYKCFKPQPNATMNINATVNYYLNFHRICLLVGWHLSVFYHSLFFSNVYQTLFFALFLSFSLFQVPSSFLFLFLFKLVLLSLTLTFSFPLFSSFLHFSQSFFLHFSPFHVSFLSLPHLSLSLSLLLDNDYTCHITRAYALDAGYSRTYPGLMEVRVCW